MEHPVRVAFCPVYFGANGGQFTELGKPIIEDPDDDGAPIRGKCDRPYDCGLCPYMHQWVQNLQAQGWVASWECYDCLKSKEENRELPGFYQEGACAKCGWETILLQLVLRK